jgi:hypothetical protein
MSWTLAIHFKHWADTQDARHILPLLVRRLVRAIVPQNAIVNFPAYEQVGRPGLDGIVEVRVGSQFIPAGKSVWEMGVNSDKKRKADEDFDKRTSELPIEVQKECTFVFITPREWRTKDEWIREKKKWIKEERSDSSWKDIAVLDANDLEHWIELCPHVDAWFATTSGHRPDGLIELSGRWESLRRIAAHPLSSALFTASRERVCADLLDWFSHQPGSLFLKSENADDAIDFLAAFAAANPPDSPHLERIFIINDLAAWRRLAISREALILVAPTSLKLNAEDIAEAVTSGHHVLILGSRTAATLAVELLLPRQEAYGIQTELQNCGFDDATARSLALACCGSSCVLKRLLTAHPQTAFPKWCDDEHRVLLAPFALIGGWVHVDPDQAQSGPLPSVVPIDLLCIEEFMELDRNSIEATVTRWSGTDDPLFLRFGSHVVIGSREDAWYLLGSAVTPKILCRFESLARLILEEDDPALDLAANDRWMANIYGKAHSLSDELRKGIIETLVLMAMYPTAGKPALSVNFGATIRNVLEVALPECASWRRWATFDAQLPLFAEADPEFLLSRMERDLSGNSPQIPELFKGEGVGFSRSWLHCGLLWALETMAWNPSLLGRVTNVLAELVKIEGTLPSNFGNRPSKTLNSIYLWWLPHTNASVEQRIAELRRLINESPSVGWALLVEMLPSGITSFCDPTVMPRWRNWAVGWSSEKVHREIPEYANRLALLVIETAAESPERWSYVIDGIFRYNDDITRRALAQLTSIATSCADTAGRATLWKKLRDLVSQHRAYPDAGWALAADILDSLSLIRDKLTPSNPVIVHGWLFKHDPELPNADVVSDYRRYAEELQLRRTSALQDIVAAQGWEGVLRLIKNVRDVNAVGWTVGKSELAGTSEIVIWELIESVDVDYRQFAISYVAGAFCVRGFGLLDHLGLESQSPDTAARVLCAIPFERATWEWIDSHLRQPFRDAYWNRCFGLVGGESQDDVTYVTERLMQAGRPFTAAEVLQMAMRKTTVDNELIYRVLEMGLSVEHNREKSNQPDSYTIQQLLKHLQETGADQLPRLSRLEWGYLPLLDHHISHVQPVTLLRELQTNPSTFVDLLNVVYRRESEEPSAEPPTDLERLHRRRARDLLDAFTSVPGSTDTDGLVDESILSTWVNSVRQLASQSDLAKVADREIGRVLSSYPQHEGVMWPPSAICRVIEVSGSEEMLRGFASGLVTRRGATTRAMTVGGDLERALASRYREIATRLNAEFPRLAQTFQHLADSYIREAEREDEDARRRRLER